MTVNWSPTPVVVGYGRLTSTRVSYLGRTPDSVTGASLSPVQGFGTLPAELRRLDIELVTIRRLLKTQ